ncbi:MAG: aspartate carbamoyltransferase [Desulfurococcales archaeon ex4484_204]|nr:MAG: aspartate carbamoyltransferase [Desulfurococcales archaeon ex4484_204]
MGALKGKDIVSALDFRREDVEELFKLADHLREEMKDEGVLSYGKGKVLATVFLEPSTRTRLSFTYAMIRLGGTVIDFGPEAASSRAKGESLEDTMLMVDGYGPDVIVLRQRTPGFAAKAAEICKAPVINAGDGWNEHPTQALLDVYTIWRELGRVDGIKVGIMGDLKYGRTPSSLSYLLSKFNNVTIYYIAPDPLQIRDEVVEKVKGKVRYYKVGRPDEVIEELDVLYVTRLQKERFPSPEEYERLKGSYRIDRDFLMRFKHIPIILHPLPRIWELDTSVDALPQAKYFEQARNGMYVRAALLKEVLGV